MIVKAIENQNLFTLIFKIQHSLEHPKNFLSFLIGILTFIPTVSIFFLQEQFTFYPTYINKFFKMFLISQWDEYLNTSPILSNIIEVLFLFTIIFLTLLEINQTKKGSFQLKILFILLRVFQIFVVPLTQNFFNLVLTANQSNSNLVLSIIMGIFLTVCLLICGVFIKFNILPFRKKGQNWNYQNDRYFYIFLLNASRVFIFCVCTPTVSLKIVIFSLVIEIYIRTMKETYKTQSWKVQVNSISNFVIGTHIGIIILLILKDQNSAGKILLLIYFFIALHCFNLYFNVQIKEIQFPMCGSDKFEFYDFYFKLKQKYFQNSSQSNQNILSWANILKTHCLNCKVQTCPIKNKNMQKDQLLQFVENHITNILQCQKKYPQDEILCQIWKMQIGKKYNLKNKQKEMKITNQYILQSALLYNLTQTQVNVHQNSNSMTNSFYQRLKQILVQISKFYDELLKSKPRIQVITQLGDKVRQNIDKIKQLYAEVLKNRAIDFKAIQLFMQFQTCFLNQDFINYDLLRKITEIQRNTISEDIEQIYLPTMTLYPQTGLIQNVNVQCLSFLQYSRYQLKTKKISQIMMPHLNIQKAKARCNQQDEVFVFVQKGTKQYTCCKVKINSKFIKNKKLDIIIFQKQKIFETNNFILVDIQFDLLLSLKHLSFIRGKHFSLQNQAMTTEVNWTDIYMESIKPRQKDLLQTKILKTYDKKSNSVIICNLLTTVQDGYFIISVKILKDSKFKLDRRSVLLPQHTNRQHNNPNSKFAFYRTSDPNQPSSLIGMMKNLNQFKKPMQYSNSLNLFSAHLRTQLVKSSLLQNRKLDKGIKTYRLYENQLYNVDLQDKQAYVEELSNKNQIKQSGQKSFVLQNEFFILAGIFLVAVILTVISVILMVSTNTSMNNVQSLIANDGQIDRFKLNYNRILASFRDAASELYQSKNRDWHPDIQSSYDKIQQNYNQKLFSNKQLNMTFGQGDFTGNLNQLLQIILAEVFSLLQFLIPERIQWIHNAAILQTVGFIADQKASLAVSVLAQFEYMFGVRNYSFGILLAGILFFYCLTVFQCYYLLERLKIKLGSILMMSDGQARQNQQNSQKIKYSIEMMKKSFQCDIKSLNIEHKAFKKRKREKIVSLGLNIKLLSLFCLIIVLTGHIFALVQMFNYFQIVKDNFYLMNFQASSIISTYADLCSLTNRIDHTGIMDNAGLTSLKSVLNNVQTNKQKLIFTQETNLLIRNYFFQNSCETLNQKRIFQNTQGLTCQNSTPGYQIETPYQIGLDMYFRRVHYNIINNFHDTFASTGIYSVTFSKVFTQLSNLMLNEILIVLQNSKQSLQIINILIIVVNIGYCLMTLFISYYLKSKEKSIQKFVKYLHLKPEQVKQKKDKILIENKQEVGIINERRRSRLLSIVQNI